MTKLLFGLGLCFAVSAVAVAEELKVGYVNAARLLEEAPQAETATSRLKEEFAPKEEEIVAAQAKVRELEEKLRRNGDIMSESRRKSLERDLLARKREARRLQSEFRDDLNFRRNEEIGELQDLVKQVIEDVGADEKYDLILYEGIAFASDKIDLTDQILERLKSRARTEASNGN